VAPNLSNILKRLSHSSMSTQEIFTRNPNGTKRDILFITPVPNNDGSGLDYVVDYQEFNTDHPEITIGTTPVFRLGKCNPVIGKLWFEGCKIPGYPYGISTGALLHLAKWVEEMRESH
jgi:hypothetical protein